MLGGSGEALVAAEFLRRGVPVYRPLVDNGADMVVDLNGSLKRVQVKSSVSDGHSIAFHFGRRSPRRNEGPSWVPYEYKPDLYALCCSGHNYIALVPSGRISTRLTFDPSCADRLNEIEIGTVIGRLLEEGK